MIVHIYNQRGIYLSLDLEVTWHAAASGQRSVCQLVIPRNSPAWDPDVLGEQGGYWVEILTPVGRWQGVTDIPQWSPGGMTVDVVEAATWFEDLRVGVGRWRGLTAGHIVRVAYRHALAGRGATALQLGHVVCAPPAVPTIEFTRQTVIDVLRTLMEQTGQEWVLQDGRLHWLPHAGRYHDLPPIVDDGRVFPALSPGTLDDQANEFIEVAPSGAAWTAYSPDPRPLRPRVVVEG